MRTEYRISVRKGVSGRDENGAPNMGEKGVRGYEANGIHEIGKNDQETVFLSASLAQ